MRGRFSAVAAVYDRRRRAQIARSMRLLIERRYSSALRAPASWRRVCLPKAGDERRERQSPADPAQGQRQGSAGPRPAHRQQRQLVQHPLRAARRPRRGRSGRSASGARRRRTLGHLGRRQDFTRSTCAQNAKWSNGDAVTANDFVESYRRILTPAIASDVAYMLYPVENAEAFHKGKLTDFAQVGFRAVDAAHARNPARASDAVFPLAAEPLLMVPGPHSDDRRNTARSSSAAAAGRCRIASSATGRSRSKNGG